MPLTRLDNLITSKTGKYLYVSPDDFNASDELNNRGNSPVRPFKSIQRAFLEVARYSYLPGVNNDRFDQFTIMLMPGEHFIDNRPGLVDTSGIDIFGFNQAANEWTDNSILDVGNPDNVLYKFNNTEGGAIIPRGTSLVGYDLRRTMVKPLYVPDPADSREKRSAIFNVTGGCYFWQFTIKDGETSSLSPLYDATDGVGKVYYSKDDFTKKAVPNYSHHKLTVFEYADKEELGLLYQKIAKAFSAYQPTIDDEGEFDVRVQENRIVGPLSDSRSIDSIQLNDSNSIPSLPGSTTQVTVTTKIDHGYFSGQFVAVTNTNIDDILEGTFQIDSIDANDPRKFTYLVPQNVASIGTGIVDGDILNSTSSPPLGQNAQTLAEVDSVESASPYVFNCSIRSTWGICGIWANGLKATGFKSMVIAQYTGVSLQKDDRAFIRYDEFTNTWNQANLTDAFDSIPYHTKGDSYWKDEWRNFHVRASEDAFIQNVSIFAVGFADHFLMESGGDMSITNSNSNFGNTSLHAIGHKGFSFNSDKGGYIDAIIPPKAIETSTETISYYPFNVPASITGVEGVQQLPVTGTRTLNDTRLYIDSEDDSKDPNKRPAVSINGYRLGAKAGEKVFTTLETAYLGDDGEYEAELAITGYKKYIAKPSILSPSTTPATDPNFHLKQDAANLISANKKFIQEETFGYVLEKYPALQTISYVNPGLDPAANRYQDARNLILSNRSEIVNSAYDSMYAAFGPAGSNELAAVPNYDETKCKRDIGLIVDAITEDLRDGGNRNIIEATRKYFNPDGTPLSNGLLGEEKFGVFAFNRARDFAKLAIANLLSITDSTITVDPANAVDPASRNKDARDLILANKSDIIDEAINAITAAYPSFVFPGGSDAKCRRDLGLIIDGLAQDINFGGNEYTVANVIEYFEGSGLLSNGVAGEVPQTIVALLKVQDQMNLAVNNQLANTDNTITLDTTGDPAIVSDSAADAFNLIKDNKKFIAKEAYERMKVAYPSYTPQTGNTEQDCLDDVYDVLDEINYNIKFGGNHKTYDAANIYVTNIYEGDDPLTFTPTGATYAPSTGVAVLTIPNHGMTQGQYVKLAQESMTFTCATDGHTTQHSYPRVTDGNFNQFMQISAATTNTITINVGVSTDTSAHTFVSADNDCVIYGTTQDTFIDAERDEAARVFTEALDVAKNVMRNITVTPTNWTPAGDAQQVRDLTIITDSGSPACASVAASLDTLFGIVTQAIGTDAGVGNLNGITRTVPAQPSTYVEGNCSDVLNTIDSLIDIFITNLNAGNLNQLPVINNGLWDCANVRATIDTLTDIITTAITDGNLVSLPAVNEGDFIVNAEASKCYRDIGFITDAIVNDLKFGGNINSVQAGEAYYVGNNLTYIDQEKNETKDAWVYIKNLAISAMRNHTTQVNGCNLVSGSSEVNVGSNVGLAIGMLVQEYSPSAFDVNGQLISGNNPITTNVPAGTYIKKLVGNDRIQLGQLNSRLDTGTTVDVTGAGNSNATLYFTLPNGQWADEEPSVDPTILTTNAGYPECAGVASVIDTLIDDVIVFIIDNGLNSVQREEPLRQSSDFASRSTLWTVDITGLGSNSPHQFETGTPVRLVPRPRFDVTTGKYVDVDKRLVRLPNGFESNRVYYVIAPGRVTTPFNYAQATEFSGNAANNNLMLAESKENAAAGIYIFSSEADAIDPDVEIDMYQFVLDEKYDLHQYKVRLDSSVSGGIRTNVAHIFDVPYSNVVPQRVFFRATEGNDLPLLATPFNNDNSTLYGGDTTAGVADSNGRLNPEYEFYVKYYANLNSPNKVLRIYKDFADAYNDADHITFISGQAEEFILYSSKKNAPLAFDPRFTAYSNSPTGRWYLKVKDTSSDNNALAIRQESILWRFQQADYLTSPPPKSDDAFYTREVDSRDKKDKVYRVRYTIPKYLDGVRDPINGFVLKTRTDNLRKLKPQKILLKPAPGTTKTDAFFENTRNAGERIGWTNEQIIAQKGTDENAYDPYRLDTTGAGIDYKKTVTTLTGKVNFTIQSGKFVDIDGDTFLELVVFDPTPDPEIPSLNNEVFRTVKISAPQGGLFTTNDTTSSVSNAVVWSGYSSGAAYIQAYFNVGSDHYLILKGNGIDGNLIYSQYTNTRIAQGNVYADLLEDPDMGKSLPLKTLIEKNIPENYYRQNRAPVYTMTPGDRIQEDGSTNVYYIDKVEDLGEIEDTFYIFDIDELQRRISGQQDGVYYLSLLRGNISPLPLGAGNQGNFRNFKFSQPISYLYPQNYKNDPFWFKYNGTAPGELAIAQALIDPPATSCAADNYIHGLVTTNDQKASVTREMIADLTQTPAFADNTYSLVSANEDNRIQAREGLASAGAEDRIIPLSGDNRVATQQKFYVELRRPSIARAGNHTFEYLGFGPGNYSTGLPARQEIVLTDTQDYYAQAKRQDAGIVFYTGINSNGELYIGNRKINAITGEEEFLERAEERDTDDEDDPIDNLVTTFKVPVTFNETITVKGGDGSGVSGFNGPILVNVDNADLTLQDAPIVIRSRVNVNNPDGSPNDPSLDRSSFNPRQSGDIFLGKNYVRAAVFQFNPRGNGQEYKIQTHTTTGVPSNITPNQNATISLGGNAIDTDQRVFYGAGANGVLPQGGDILLKGGSIQQSGSLGWIFSNYFNDIDNNYINTLQFGMVNGEYVKISWANYNGTQYTNQNLGISETSTIRIENFFPSSVANGNFPIVSPPGDPFLPSATYLYIRLPNSLASVVYNDASNVQQLVSIVSWSVMTNAAVLANNNVSVAPSMEASNAVWKEIGMLGAEAVRTDTEKYGEFKFGINTLARADHSSYEDAFVDLFTDPRATLDVVGNAFISGKSITYANWLANDTFAARTENALDNALIVGGNSASPNNSATFRVMTTNGGRVGINVSNSELAGSGVFGVNLSVDGTGYYSGNVRIEQDLAVNGGDLTSTANTFRMINANVTQLFMGADVETLEFANAGTDIELFNDATAAQAIKVGNAATSQTIDVGNAATTQTLNIAGAAGLTNQTWNIGRNADNQTWNIGDLGTGGTHLINIGNSSNIGELNIHRNSLESTIRFGTTSNTNVNAKSIIEFGGGFANEGNSRFVVNNYQTILQSSILEINDGLTTTTGNENTDIEVQTNARTIDFFTRGGAGLTVNAFTSATDFNLGSLAGFTRIRNTLAIGGDVVAEGDFTLNGGNNTGSVEVTRGELNTTDVDQSIGSLQNLNIDFFKFIPEYTDVLRFTNAAVSNNTLVIDNIFGPNNFFQEGNVVRFTNVDGLSGVTVGTLYYAYQVSGQTLKLTTSIQGTTPVTITGTPTNARIVLDGVKIDTSGQQGAGTTISASETTLPLNSVNGLTSGDFLLIGSEIVRCSLPPDQADRTIQIERGYACTTAAVHADNAVVAKLELTEEATYIREGDSGVLDTTVDAGENTIPIGEFSGTLSVGDYLRLNATTTCPSGEFVRITAINLAESEKFKINDGDGNDRMVIDSVCGGVTSTLTGDCDFRVQLTTNNNEFRIESSDNVNVPDKTLILKRSGEIRMIGTGSESAPEAVIESDGNAKFTGTLRVSDNNALNTNKNNMEFDLESDGDLDIAGTLDMTDRLRIYPGSQSTGTNYGGTPYFDLNQGNLTITNNFTIGGDLAVNGCDITTTCTTFNLLNQPNTMNFATGAENITIGNSGGEFYTNDGALTVTGVIRTTSNVPASSTTTGALIVAGGAGIGRDLWLGEDLFMESDHVFEIGDMTLIHQSSNGESIIREVGSGGLTIQTNNFQIKNQSGNESIGFGVEDGGFTLYYNNSAKLATDNEGINVTGDIDVSDDIRLGDDMFLLDGGRIYFGAGNDLQIFHDGTNSYISEVGTGALIFQGSEYSFRNAGNSEQLAKFTQNGSVDLYHNNNLRLQTNSAGVDIFDDLDVADDIEAGGSITCVNNLTVNDGNGDPIFEIESDKSTTLAGIDNFFGPTGARRWDYIDESSSNDSNAPVLTANISYITNTGNGDVLILKLPASPSMGDAIRIIDGGGNLSYNTQLVIRAQGGARMMGELNGSSLGLSSGSYTGGGELIVNTPYAALGLVYIGSPAPSSLRGWRLMEV